MYFYQENEFKLAMWSPDIAHEYTYMKKEVMPLRDTYINALERVRKLSIFRPAYGPDGKAYSYSWHITEAQIKMMHGQVDMVADYIKERFIRCCEEVFRGVPVSNGL